jgi:hypothetical protein
VGLRPLACWDCEFESRGGHGYLSIMIVVGCQVDSPGRADHSSRGVLSSVIIESSIMRRPWLNGGFCAMVNSGKVEQW